MKKSIALTVLLLMMGAMVAPFAMAAEISTAKLYYYYPEDQSVDIVGVDFTPNAEITLTVNILEAGTHFEDTLTSDANGGFTYTYQLDGTPYTYVATATDGTNTATCTFYDPQTKFSVTISPDTVTTSKSYTFTTTIIAGSPTSVNSIGSITISLDSPSSWGTPSDISVTTVGGKTWDVGTGANEPSAGTFKVYADTSSDIIPISSSGTVMFTIQFTITTPSTSGAHYYISVTTYTNRDWTGTDGSDSTKFVRVEYPPSLSYVDDSLTPISVTAGDTDVVFSVNIVNGGGVRAGVTLSTYSYFSFTDGTHSYTAYLQSDTHIAKGDGSGTLTFVANDIPSAMADGSYTPTLHLVAVDGVDDNGASFGPVNPLVTPVALRNQVTVTGLTPANDPPTAEFSWTPETPKEGEEVTFTDESTDSDGTVEAWSWDFDDGGTSIIENPKHTFADNGVYTVSLTVTDDDGDSDSVSHDITVNNVAPDITSITCPVDPFKVLTEVTVSAAYTDPGILDTQTATWSWGDGSDPSSGVVTYTTGSGGSGTVEGKHTYSTAGLYQVELTVTDKDGGTDTLLSTCYIVVYDPNAGFVTGGGWINSPAGAYYADPSLTGKATFGFVSQYKKGANVPTGNTEFQFHVANMNFKSTSYQWLVVTGGASPRAQYKGFGTINGGGNYGFMLTAVDKKTGDLFRIKIWDIDNANAIVYDNMKGASDLDTLTTVIASGSIVIH